MRALIVANEFLESEVCELMQAVSHAYEATDFIQRPLILNDKWDL
jgi:hypothetical protein